MLAVDAASVYHSNYRTFLSYKASLRRTSPSVPLPPPSAPHHHPTRSTVQLHPDPITRRQCHAGRVVLPLSHHTVSPAGPWRPRSRVISGRLPAVRPRVRQTLNPVMDEERSPVAASRPSATGQELSDRRLNHLAGISDRQVSHHRHLSGAVKQNASLCAALKYISRALGMLRIWRIIYSRFLIANIPSCLVTLELLIIMLSLR